MVQRRCPQCGSQLTVDKLTSSGREIRDYDCPTCGWGESEDRGPAMWTMMSEDGIEAYVATDALAELEDDGNSKSD